MSEPEFTRRENSALSTQLTGTYTCHSSGRKPELGLDGKSQTQSILHASKIWDLHLGSRIKHVCQLTPPCPKLTDAMLRPEGPEGEECLCYTSARNTPSMAHRMNDEPCRF